MKKIFLFLVALVGIVACSKGDSGSSESGGNSGGGNVTGYNPPSWIIGTWISDLTKTTGYSFTKDDHCMIVHGSTCYFSGVYANIVSKVEQEIKGDVYTIKIIMNDGSSTYEKTFKKIADNKIAELNLVGEIEYTFTKKK
ncbi:hypothetical protein [Capnocytophaga granulosa]|jgi:hypothetical protein